MKTRLGVLIVLAGVLWGCGGGPTQPDLRVQDPPVTPVATVTQVAVTPHPTTTPIAIQPTPCRPQKYCQGFIP